MILVRIASVIGDHSDYARSNELKNTCPEWIHQFIILIPPWSKWSWITDLDLDHLKGMQPLLPDAGFHIFRSFSLCLKLKQTHILFVFCNVHLVWNLCETGVMCNRWIQRFNFWSFDYVRCIVKEFDFPMFICVQLAKILGEFDYVLLLNPVRANRMIGAQSSSITELLNVQLTMLGNSYPV